MKLTLEIKMDNAAFDDDQEIVRILRHAAERVSEGNSVKESKYVLCDINGNVVGHYIVKDESELVYRGYRLVKNLGGVNIFICDVTRVVHRCETVEAAKKWCDSAIDDYCGEDE